MAVYIPHSKAFEKNSSPKKRNGAKREEWDKRKTRTQ